MTQAGHLRLVHNATDGAEPPHDPDAEASVISAAIVAADALPKVIDFLRPEHFYSEAHRRIFEACVALYRARTPIDAQTVSSWLLARNRLAQVGGLDAVVDLISASSAYSNVRSHAVAVHDAWRRRQVIFACQKIAATGYGGVGDVQAWCEGAVRTMGAIGAQNPIRPVETSDQCLARIVREINEPAVSDKGTDVPITGYPTGIFGLDRIVGGFRKGAKTTIAACTGIGKTAFAGQMAISAARQGMGVLFFSMEMKRQEILLRALAHESRVSSERIRKRLLSSSDKTAISQAALRLKGLPWRIDETPSPTIEEVAAIAKTMRDEMPLAEHVPLGMIVLDYIQRIEPSAHVRHREVHEQIAHATKGFKKLCQELDVVGIELAQAKEGPPGRRPEKPTAQRNIADCGKIAKESDDVIFLWPEDDPHDDPRQSVLAIVAKQRAGRKGEIPLMFRRDIYTFVDPNTPGASNPSRQYVDNDPMTEGL